MDDVKNYLRLRRKQLGLTLEEVGKAVGVTKSTVRKWETGLIANMRRDKIQKLAEVLQISPTIFTGLSGPQYEVGHLLKEERLKQHMDINDIAKKFNISNDEYQNIEDEIEPIDGLLAEAIAAHFGHSVEDLYFLSDNYDGHIPDIFEGDALAYKDYLKALDKDQAIDSALNSMMEDNRRTLNKLFEKLNIAGQKEAIKQVDNLTLITKYTDYNSDYSALLKQYEEHDEKEDVVYLEPQKQKKEDPYTVIAAHNDNEDPDQYELMMEDAADLLDDDD